MMEGSKLNDAIKKAGMRKADFAHLVDTSYQHLQLVVTGKQNASPELWKRIENALLMFEGGDTPKSAYGPDQELERLRRENRMLKNTLRHRKSKKDKITKIADGQSDRLV